MTAKASLVSTNSVRCWLRAHLATWFDVFRLEMTASAQRYLGVLLIFLEWQTILGSRWKAPGGMGEHPPERQGAWARTHRVSTWKCWALRFYWKPGMQCLSRTLPQVCADIIEKNCAKETFQCHWQIKFCTCLSRAARVLKRGSRTPDFSCLPSKIDQLDKPCVFYTLRQARSPRMSNMFLRYLI